LLNLDSPSTVFSMFPFNPDLYREFKRGKGEREYTVFSCLPDLVYHKVLDFVYINKVI